MNTRFCESVKECLVMFNSGSLERYAGTNNNRKMGKKERNHRGFERNRAQNISIIISPMLNNTQNRK